MMKVRKPDDGTRRYHVHRRPRGHRRRFALAAPVVGLAAALLGSVPALAAGASYQVGPVTDVSSCGGQNAEVEQAVDPKLG
jgi:hypothetical protein